MCHNCACLASQLRRIPTPEQRRAICASPTHVHAYVINGQRVVLPALLPAHHTPRRADPPQQPPNLAQPQGFVQAPWNPQPAPRGFVRQAPAPWNPQPAPRGFVGQAPAPRNPQPAPRVIVVHAPQQHQRAPRQQAPQKQQQGPPQQAPQKQQQAPQKQQQAPQKQQQGPPQQWDPANCPYGSGCDGHSCGNKIHSWEDKNRWEGHCDKGRDCGHHKLRNGECQKLHP